MRCIIACLAVWAAMRPKFRGVTSTSTSSPACASALILRACRRNFVLRIGDILDHERFGQSADLTGLRIDIDAQFARHAHALFRRRKKRVRDRLEQDLALDPALPLEVIQHGNKFGVHKTSRPPDKKEWDTSSHSSAARSSRPS